MISSFLHQTREQDESDYLRRMAAHAGLRLIGVQMGIGLENSKVVVENPVTKKTISIIYDEHIETRLAKYAVQPKPEPKISDDVESLPNISSQDIEFLESLQRIAQELSNASAELNALCMRRKQS